MDGNALHAARQQLGLTCDQLAARLRLTGRYRKDKIREMEEGKRPISGPIAVAVELMVERDDWSMVVEPDPLRLVERSINGDLDEK